jgi:hypothetical protein
MAEARLSVRSAKACDLARRVARRENRTLAEVVERALELYEVQNADREPALSFYKRPAANSPAGIDLEAIIRGGREEDSDRTV